MKNGSVRTWISWLKLDRDGFTEPYNVRIITRHYLKYSKLIGVLITMIPIRILKHVNVKFFGANFFFLSSSYFFSISFFCLFAHLRHLFTHMCMRCSFLIKFVSVETVVSTIKYWFLCRWSIKTYFFFVSYYFSLLVVYFFKKKFSLSFFYFHYSFILYKCI